MQMAHVTINKEMPMSVPDSLGPLLRAERQAPNTPA